MKNLFWNLQWKNRDQNFDNHLLITTGAIPNNNQGKPPFFYSTGSNRIYFDLLKKVCILHSALKIKTYCNIKCGYTVWSEGFLYKVAPSELKILPIIYFVIHNSVVLSKILKIIVPFWLLLVYFDYHQNNQFYRVKNRIFKILLLWHNNFQYFG